MENNKLATMHEAEKTSRKRLTASHKKLNKVLESLFEKVGLSDANNHDELVNKIQELVVFKIEAGKKLENYAISMEKMML